jgi:hypothetical protein
MMDVAKLLTLADRCEEHAVSLTQAYFDDGADVYGAAPVIEAGHLLAVAASFREMADR